MHATTAVTTATNKGRVSDSKSPNVLHLGLHLHKHLYIEIMCLLFIFLNTQDNKTHNMRYTNCYCLQQQQNSTEGIGDLFGVFCLVCGSNIM